MVVDFSNWEMSSICSIALLGVFWMLIFCAYNQWCEMFGHMSVVFGVICRILLYLKMSSRVGKCGKLANWKEKVVVCVCILLFIIPGVEGTIVGDSNESDAALMEMIIASADLLYGCGKSLNKPKNTAMDAVQ